MISIGIPTFVLVRKFWRVNLWTALVAGFLDGVLITIFLFPKHLDIHFALIYGLIGAISAFVFWLIWKRGTSTT